MKLWLLPILLFLAGGPAGAATESFIYNRNPAELDGIDRYVWKVLEATLRRTRDRYGDYRLGSVPDMPTTRRAYALEHGEDGITVGLFADNPERERLLVPVRIPVDRGLSSYRLLLILASEQPRFSRVASVADLAHFRLGLLPWWSDAAVMKRSNLPVVAGDTYDGLFQMLAARRFDALSRSAREVLPEFESKKESVPGLAIENHLLLHYPMPVYFWFRNDEAGRRRAERVEAGLKEMAADGTLKKMFDAEFGRVLSKLDLAHRLVLELPNPLLDSGLLPGDPELWYRP